MNQNANRAYADRYQSPRARMIADLRRRGIGHEPTLAAMEQVERRLFVSEALASRAYDDYAAPIGSSQTISRPYTVALMTSLLELTGKEKALEIGTGSGYQAAVLSRLCDKLYTIERIKELSNKARKIFNELKIDNIVCLAGDGTLGAQTYAPFDVIMVTAVGPKIPEPLAKQLADGGKMVVPVEENGVQRIHLIRREGNTFRVTRKEECAFVPLIGQHGHAR